MWREGREGADGSSPANRAALPDAHEDQVHYGFRMIQNAFTGRVQALEQELRNLRTNCDEQKNQATLLQRKNSTLEAELLEGNQRTSQLAEENKELFKTVQQLRRQLLKLEGLKKKVLESITDDGPEPEEFPRSAAPVSTASLPVPAAPGNSYGASGTAPWPSTAPALPANGYAGEERPIPSQPAWPRSPAASTEVSTSAVLDGKMFFRQARASLPPKAFEEFLGHIKRLNSQQQTREETLAQARRLFGPELDHLYREFEQLLNRHGG